MAQVAETHQPSPALFFETMNAYQRTAALKAAIELDLFTAIGEGAHTAAALAQRCEASERGMRILCDYLVVIGFLTKDENRYGLTPDSAAFLDRRSPSYIATAATFLASPMLTEGFDDVAAVVRKGGTVISEEGSLEPEHPVWVEFARAMAPLMTLPAELIAKLVGADSGQKWKVLDIAAGHGLFGIAIAKHNPNAEIVALDWPNVLEVAKENARAAGVADRYGVIPGSAFEVDYGTGYDLVLLTNFLHHFDPETCELLLRKVYAALETSGRAVSFEFVPNEDRVSPPVAASFSLMMLGTTPSGDAYTFAELDRMFRNTGFSRSELHPLPPTFQQVVISHKK
jgi:ubiquinone/menaquinone biosynthesis C-methylase UbiE